MGTDSPAIRAIGGVEGRQLADVQPVSEMRSDARNYPEVFRVRIFRAKGCSSKLEIYTTALLVGSSVLTLPIEISAFSLGVTSIFSIQRRIIPTSSK